MMSLDTETTGVDFHHGAKPFFVTACRPGEDPIYWEWDVDPITREPQATLEDLEEIEQLLVSEDEWVLQNAKFDYHALQWLGIENWDWSKVKDTLIAGHLLGTNLPHDLTSMVKRELNQDIQPFEDKLQIAVLEARKVATKRFPKWKIAKEGLPMMPSAKGGSKKQAKGVASDKPWKFDTWLPRAIAKACEYPANHLWWTVLSDYANVDSESTVALWPVQQEQIQKRGLWEIFETRMKLLPIAAKMEHRGVSLSRERLEAYYNRFSSEVEDASNTCRNIAKIAYGYDLILSGKGSGKSVPGFMFDELKVPVVKRTEKGNPSLDADALESLEATLPAGGFPSVFVKNLLVRKKYAKALEAMAGYKRFWLLNKETGEKDQQLWYRLFAHLNPTGTNTLRWSSSNPNEQNISKQEGANLRWIFGPDPGREWWSLDAQNVELRIPAFEAGETELINVFLRPQDAPYYGSYHLVVFDALHPELFKKYGVAVKDLFESTWYQWVKNGNFAMIYGCQERKADETFRVPGAYKILQHRFPKIAKLAEKQKALAKRHGYVETIPDMSVCPDRGYPILAKRSEYGSILPTTPLNYHISGTAMWWTGKAMIRCDAMLEEWNKAAFDGHIILQVHDEMVFDFPKAACPVKDPANSNLGRARVMQRLMEMGGNDIGLPTPVGIKYHPENWDARIKI